MSVYFISARELDLVKIGYAFNPVARHKHLRIFSPVELTLEGAIPGGYDKERELHRQFASTRARGEWFRLSPGLQAEIDASTRPERFTWASVRLWLKMLEQEDEALAPPTVPRHEIEARVQMALAASAHRSSLTRLQRLEADGAITFPFRTLEETS